MPETFSAEDEAALYALDGLTPSERRKFEARLAESAELRAMVRDFEEGAVALTLTAAPKGLPKGAWAKIETTIAKETRAKSIITSIWTEWWRQGWAAAAACLAGWLIYGIWTNRGNPADAQNGTRQLAQSGDGKMESRGSAAAPNGTGLGNGGLGGTTNVAEALRLRMKEVTALRREVSDLESRITNLSDAVAQQESMLGESNRVRIFQLTPANGTGDGTNAAPSPEMQRALFLAMAKQLGWGPMNGGAGTNMGGVQFIDLRPNAEVGTSATSVKPSENETEASTAPTAATNMVATIPAFQSESNVFLAIDSSVAPSGSQVTVASNDGQTSNNATTDGGTTVIVVPTGLGEGGWYLTISGSGGLSNFYQYWTATATNHP